MPSRPGPATPRSAPRARAEVVTADSKRRRRRPSLSAGSIDGQEGLNLLIKSVPHVPAATYAPDLAPPSTPPRSCRPARLQHADGVGHQASELPDPGPERVGHLQRLLRRPSHQRCQTVLVSPPAWHHGAEHHRVEREDTEPQVAAVPSSAPGPAGGVDPAAPSAQERGSDDRDRWRKTIQQSCRCCSYSPALLLLAVFTFGPARLRVLPRPYEAADHQRPPRTTSTRCCTAPATYYPTPSATPSSGTA